MLDGSWPIIVLVLVLLAFTNRAVTQSWLTPSSIFAVFWLGATVAPLVFTSFAHSEAAGWLIVEAVLAWTVGACVASGGRRVPRTSAPLPPMRTQLLRAITRVGIVSGVVAGLVALRDNGQSVTSLLSLDRLLSTTGEIASANTSDSFVTAVLLIPTYCAALVVPFWTKRARYVLGPTGAALFTGLITSRRLSYLLCAALTCGGLLAASMLRRGRMPRATARSATVAIVAVTFLAAAFSAGAFLRVGSTDEQLRPILFSKMQVYAFGYLSGFSTYVDQTKNLRPTGWGAETFGGVAGIVGAHGVSRGYADRAVIDPQTGASTNIYSSFRQLFDDFGTSVSLVFLAAVGFGVEVARRRVLTRRSLYAAIVVALAVTWILTSTFQSPFIFTNVCIALAVAVVALRPRRKRAVRIVWQRQPLPIRR